MVCFTRCVLLALVLGLLCPLARAGVLSVGPGGTYVDIAAALAAAQPGDTILVQPGTYGPFQVDKPVRIAATGPGVVIAATGASAIRLVNLGAGDEVGLFNLEVRANPIVALPPASVVVENSQGTVLLSGLSVRCQFAGIGVYAANCERLVLVDCSIDACGSLGPPQSGALESFNSNVYLVSTRIRGHKGGGGFAEAGDHAMTASGGSVTLWRSELFGGAGALGKGFLIVPLGGDGLRVSNTAVRHFGGPGSLLAGGNGAMGGFFMPAAGGTGLRLLDGSSAVVQDSVGLQGGLAPAPGGPTADALISSDSNLSGDPTLYPTWLARLSTPALGGTLSIPMAGAPGAQCFPFATLATGAAPAFPGIEGLLFLDVARLIPGSPFALDSTGIGTPTSPIPSSPGLLGVGLWVQAISFDGTKLALSNPLGVLLLN
jgi:hypothetical protein